MEKLRLYTIDKKYLEYLYKTDNRVMYWENKSYKKERKYLGIVLEVNGFRYFAPLSSPKDNDYIYIKGERKIKRNTIPIFRLVTDKGSLLGKIKLSNMIPVKEENLSLYDLKNEQDKKYKDLISDELICIRKNRQTIIKNARILYNQKTNNYENINYLKYTLNFKELENACLNYQK